MFGSVHDTLGFTHGNNKPYEFIVESQYHRFKSEAEKSNLQLEDI